METALRYVNFHGIGAWQRPLERGEDRLWLEVDRFCHILDRICEHPDRDKIRITFDDGNMSDLTVAVPELLRRGLRARFFIVANRIGEQGSLGRADLRSLISAGMEIGSHGMDHVDWTRLPKAELERQLRGSKAMIADATGVEVKAAAIPFGRYNAAVLHLLGITGYAAAYSSDRGAAFPRRFLRPRTSVTATMSDIDIGNILSARMLPAGRLRRWAAMTMKRWL